MPEIYLANFKWNPPSAFDAEGYWSSPYPDKTLGAIDLRTDARAGIAGGPGGWGIFSMREAIADPTLFSLGNDINRVADSQKTILKGELGLASDLLSSTMRGILYEIINGHGDPSGETFCKPQMPGRDCYTYLFLGGFGNVRINRTVPGKSANWPKILEMIHLEYRELRDWSIAGIVRTDLHREKLTVWVQQYRVKDYSVFIPDDLPDERPLPHGTTLLDDFNRADSASLGASSDGDWSWTEVEDFLEILNNEVNNAPSGGQTSARAEKDLSTSQMQVEADITVDISGSKGGVSVRYQPAATTYYRGTADRVSGDDNDVFVIGKVIAGSFTSLATATTGSEFSTGLLRLKINGSILELFNDGVSKLTVMDMSIASGTRAGIAGKASGSDRLQWDNFKAEDLRGFRSKPLASPFRTKPVASRLRTKPIPA